MQSTNRIGCFNSKENHMGSSMKSNTHEFLDISHETKKNNLQGCFNSNHMGSSMKSYTHEFLDMFSWNKKNNLQSSLTYKKNIMNLLLDIGRQ